MKRVFKPDPNAVGSTAVTNVGEMKKFIADLPDDMEFIISNEDGSSPLCEANSQYLYIPESTWQGELHNLTNSSEENGMSDPEWVDMQNDHKPYIVLWSIN